MTKEEKAQWLYEEYKYTKNFDFNRLDKYEEANDDICIDDLILDYTMLYEFYKEEIERLNIIDRIKDYCFKRMTELNNIKVIDKDKKVQDFCDNKINAFLEIITEIKVLKDGDK